jgi:hypothetical protein
MTPSLKTLEYIQRKYWEHLNKCARCKKGNLCPEGAQILNLNGKPKVRP